MEEQYYDPNQDVSNIQVQNERLTQKNLELSGAMASMGVLPEEEQNLIQYQLETDKFLERMRNYLKGNELSFDAEGNAFYTEPVKSVLTSVKKDVRSGVTYYIQEVKENLKGSEVQKKVLVRTINRDGVETNILERDSKMILGKLRKQKKSKGLKIKNLGYQYVDIIDEEMKPFNERGVQEFMRIISMYVTKETFLSIYTEDRINEIMGDLGDAMNNFLYCGYDVMGMNTKFKESKYTIILLNIFHAIESCYRRSIDGAEQQNLRTRAIVTQNQGGSNLGGMNRVGGVQKEKWHPLKKSTW